MDAIKYINLSQFSDAEFLMAKQWGNTCWIYHTTICLSKICMHAYYTFVSRQIDSWLKSGVDDTGWWRIFCRNWNELSAYPMFARWRPEWKGGAPKWIRVGYPCVLIGGVSGIFSRLLIGGDVRSNSHIQ